MSDDQQQQPEDYTEQPPAAPEVPDEANEQPPALEEPSALEQPPATDTQATDGQIPGAEKKVLAGILAIIFGCLGVHKFVLGYQKEGIIMIAVSVAGMALSFLCIPIFATTAMSVIGLVEGIMYLTKSDEEFVNTYIANKKPWF